MTSSQRIDALVVGARCAGATLALFLRRAGRRVLLVDADDLPSDQPMSTHFIQGYGMEILDELGLGDRVRAIAPPVPWFLNGTDETPVWIEMPEGARPSCPRRLDLDGLLFEEVRAAGIEVRRKTRLVDVVREGGRVVGGVVEHAGGRETLRAGVVVGADGRHSTTAGLVGAEEYKSYDAPRGVYWGYWPRPKWYEDDPRYRGTALIVHHGDEFVFVFPTNRDQLVIGLAFPLTRLGEWRGRHRETLIRRLRGLSVTTPLVEGEPIGRVLGLVRAKFFFRQAAGPGWALVGDAGLFKDPMSGLGISDAFRDARALSAAIVAGGDAALEHYWRARDVQSIELFEFARTTGDPGYNNPFNRLVFERLAASAELRRRIIAVNQRKVSPFAAFSTREVLGWVGSALLRGRFDVLGGFFASGRRANQVREEIKARVALADNAGRRSASWGICKHYKGEALHSRCSCF